MDRVAKLVVPHSVMLAGIALPTSGVAANCSVICVTPWKRDSLYLAYQLIYAAADRSILVSGRPCSYA